MNQLTQLLPKGHSLAKNAAPVAKPSILLIGPYDPTGGEYTFLSPPLGVWRLSGVLQTANVRVTVFDPNCCEGSPQRALEDLLTGERWNVVGISTTGMTLRYDLELAHLVRRVAPGVLIVAGGMEATFDPAAMFRLGPFDLVVLGEGERPLVELSDRLRQGASLSGIPGTAFRGADGTVQRLPQAALNHDELRSSIFQIPYAQMPYPAYWQRLERAYRAHELPMKAEREALLAEIASVRLITLNYCPMGCTFCSSTNFLHAAQGGSTAKIARLDAEECMAMVRTVVHAQPQVRTIIFQDDIFVFTQDQRILALCDAIVKAKASGDLPPNLQFISTNRIDAMNPERLMAMRQAGFRVLGFGIESFSLGILKEFKKAQIFPHIRPVLDSALKLGITPFLDMILTSPHCTLEDLAENIRQAFYWVQAGCEVGMYPYVIPFSGAALASDATLQPHTIYERRTVASTNVAWHQPTKILPIDPAVRKAILRIEADFEAHLSELAGTVPHLPSRTRSLVWIAAAIPVLERAGYSCLPEKEVAWTTLREHLPVSRSLDTPTSLPAEIALAVA